jgi:putative ABC transport system permease protein
VAKILDLKRGDLVEVEILEGKRGTRWVPVVEIIQSYIGMSAYMHIEALNQLLDEGPNISGVHVSYDTGAEKRLFAWIKSTPAISAIALQRLSLAKFRETLAATTGRLLRSTFKAGH